MISSYDASSLSVAAYKIPRPTLRDFSTATIASFNETYGSAAANVGFSATTFVSDQTIVIAYRGTDEFSDVLNGWGIGLGSPFGSQAEYAVRYYQAVKSQYPNAEIVLTGHSLGGGLAGLVGALYGKVAFLFDHEPFEAAAESAINMARLYDEWSADVALNGTSSIYYASFVEYGDFLSDARELFFGSGDVGVKNLRGITGTFVDGEILELIRGSEPVPMVELNLGKGTILDPVDRHDVSLLSIRHHADVYGSGVDWDTVGKYVIPALFNNGISHSAELSVSSMRGALALASLSIDTNPISGYYSDVKDLQNALTRGLQDLEGRFYEGAIVRYLANVSAQFAGMSAAGYINSNLVGVLNYDADEYVMRIDYSDSKSVNSVGFEVSTLNNYVELFNAAVSNNLGSVLEDIWDHLYKYFTLGNTSIEEVVELQIALDPEGFDGAISTALDGLLVFFGTSLRDVVEGTIGRDIIFSAESRSEDAASLDGDMLNGGAGDDFLVGSSRRDTVIGGEGNDFIVTGAGDDTVIVGEMGSDGLVDYNDDWVFAGDGHDKIFAGAGRDILSGGQEDDEFYISAPQGAPSRSAASESGGTIIWGGEGADKYYFSGSARVLMINTPSISDEILRNIDVSKLWDAVYELNIYADYILVNVDAEDSIYLDNKLLGDAFIEQKNLLEIGDPSDLIYSFSGYYDLGGREIWKATHFTQTKTEYFYRHFETVESEIYYDAYREGGVSYLYAGDNLGVSSSSVWLWGVERGKAGITLNGNDFAFRYEVTTKTSNIHVDQVAYRTVSEDNLRVYERPASYSVVSEIYSVVVEEDYELKPPGFDNGRSVELDLLQFVTQQSEGSNRSGNIVGEIRLEVVDAEDRLDKCDDSAVLVNTVSDWSASSDTLYFQKFGNTDVAVESNDSTLESLSNSSSIYGLPDCALFEEAYPVIEANLAATSLHQDDFRFVA